MNCRLLAAMLIATCLAASAPAGEKYAFLVAVGEYDRKELKPLQFPRNDIQELHQLLLEAGYDKSNIVLMHDDAKNSVGRRFFPESVKIREELRLLLAGLEKDDSLIVAFSGHGVQFKGDKQNYFCPADVKLDDRKSLIAVTEIYAALEKCPARQKLLLVDACRDDPQSALSRARQSVELESVTRPQSEAVPEGLVAIFSCAAGQRSFEDPDLKHGIFFHHVLEAMKGAADDGDDELTLDELVSFTKKKTQTFARTTFAAVQTPQQLGNFTGTWVLRELKGAAPMKTVDTKPKPPLTPPPSSGRPEPPPIAPPSETRPPLPGGTGKKAGAIFQNSIGMELVRIPAGEYVRGAPAHDTEAAPHERPQHRVRITRDFYMGVYEVTQAEWYAVMKSEPWKGEDKVTEGRDVAATWINWDDAAEFCRKLSLKEGREYRLPTEAEWEYACRAGSTTIYHFGDGKFELDQHAWYGGMYPPGSAEKEPFAHKVGLKKPNKFGLFDMHGNVKEWCGDWHDPQEYQRYADAIATDPTGPATPGKSRIVRGGSWWDTHYMLRTAIRDHQQPSYRFTHLGMRVVTVAKPND